MSKRAAQEKKANRDASGSAHSTTTTTTTKLEDTFLPPLKPLPTLFKVLMLGFALWLGALLTLYYKTVYPLRHEASGTATTRPGASALPSAPR